MKFENIKVFNFENSFRGMRNPKNSWDKSDSIFSNSNDIDKLIIAWENNKEAVIRLKDNEETFLLILDSSFLKIQSRLNSHLFQDSLANKLHEISHPYVIHQNEIPLTSNLLLTVKNF